MAARRRIPFNWTRRPNTERRVHALDLGDARVVVLPVVGLDRRALRRARARPFRRGRGMSAVYVTGSSGVPAKAMRIAGKPLSQVPTPSTPRLVGSERIKRRNTIAASLR